nr:hypothetical protein CFP56_53637 [Quercus suber]
MSAREDCRCIGSHSRVYPITCAIRESKIARRDLTPLPLPQHIHPTTTAELSARYTIADRAKFFSSPTRLQRAYIVFIVQTLRSGRHKISLHRRYTSEALPIEKPCVTCRTRILPCSLIPRDPHQPSGITT